MMWENRRRRIVIGAVTSVVIFTVAVCGLDVHDVCCGYIPTGTIGSVNGSGASSCCCRCQHQNGAQRPHPGLCRTLRQVTITTVLDPAGCNPATTSTTTGKLRVRRLEGFEDDRLTRGLSCRHVVLGV